MDAHEATIYSAILITGVIIGIIIIYFIISIIRHQRRNIESYKAKIVAEIATLEKERTRIASDLHDEIGPVLSSIKFKINSIDINNDEDKFQLEKASMHIDDIIKRMREISNDLMPNTLLRKGPIYAIAEFIDQVVKTDKLKIEFKYYDVPEIPAERSIHLYRIIQEIIHNTVKHARAHNLKIELKTINDCLVLLSEDNGAGFDYSTASKENYGLGLRNLLNRTELLHGSMFVDSRHGKGTKFTIEIPLKERQLI